MNILQQEDVIKGLPDNVLMQQAQQPTGELPEFLVVSEIQRREKMRKSFSETVPEQSVKDQVLSSGIAAMNPNIDPLMASAMGAQGGQDPMMGQMQDPMQQQMMQDPMQQQMMQQQMMQDPMQQQMPMQDPMMQQQVMAAGGGMMPYRMDAGGGTPSTMDFSRSAISPDRVRLLRAEGYSDEQIQAMIVEGSMTAQDLYGVGEEADIFKGRTSYPLVPESVTEGVKDALENSGIAKYGFGYKRNEGSNQGLIGAPMGAVEDLMAGAGVMSDLSERARQSQVVRDPIGSSNILSLIDRGIEVPRRAFGQLADGFDEITREGGGIDTLMGQVEKARQSEFARDPFGVLGDLANRTGNYLITPNEAVKSNLLAGADSISNAFSDAGDSVTGVIDRLPNILQGNPSWYNAPDVVPPPDALTKDINSAATKEQFSDPKKFEKSQAVLEEVVLANGDKGAANPKIVDAYESIGTDAGDPEGLLKGLFGRSYKPMDDGALALINLGAGIAKGDVSGGMLGAVKSIGESRDRDRKDMLAKAQAEFYASGGRGAKDTLADLTRVAQGRLDKLGANKYGLYKELTGKTDLTNDDLSEVNSYLMRYYINQIANEERVPASAVGIGGVEDKRDTVRRLNSISQDMRLAQ